MPVSWEKHVQQVTDHCRQASKQYLRGVEKRLKDAGLDVRSEVLVAKTTAANPAEEIIDYVHRNPFNLIAMSTHGRYGLTRWAYGSVADRVLHGVSNPLFLIRPGQF